MIISISSNSDAGFYPYLSLYRIFIFIVEIIFIFIVEIFICKQV